MADSRELTGWGEIAKYLGVSVRTAQLCERRGLPVYRLPGPKGRVWASSHELDAWKAGNHRRLAKHVLPFEDSHTLVEVTEAALAFREIPTKNPSPEGSPRTLSYSLVALVVLVIVALGSHAAYVPHGPPADYRVQGNDVIAVNSQGRELWRHTCPWPLRESAYAESEHFMHSWIGDLDGSGERRFLFEAVSYKAGAVGTPIICFRGNGKIKWQFEPGRAVVDGSGEHQLPPYPANNLLVIAGRNRAETRIVISSNHYVSHANQVAFLDVDGRVIGEYWHPGHLLHLEQADLDRDGGNELLLAGVNNGNHQATLVIIDPLKVSGIVTPKEMQDRQFELLNMSAAHERAVVFFPRSCVSIAQPYTRATAVHVTRERIVVQVAEGFGEGFAGFVYELDFRLHVVNVVPTGLQVEQRHQELEAQGKLDHPFDAAKECERLRAAVIVRRSE